VTNLLLCNCSLSVQALFAYYYIMRTNSGKSSADSKKKSTKTSSTAVKSGATFKEDEGEVDAMEEEMGAAAAADADQERVSCLHYFLL